MSKDHYEGLLILGKNFDFKVIKEIVHERMLADIDPFVLLIYIKHKIPDARQLEYLPFLDHFELFDIIKRNRMRPDFTVEELEQNREKSKNYQHPG